jgi:N utilization substance protein A
MDEELIKVIGEVEKEKGLEKDVIIEALEAAMLTAARKRKGLVADLEANFDPETGEVNVIEFKKVVETVENPDLEITLDQALAIEDDPDLQIGDEIGLLIPTEELGRIAAQTAKQVIIQRVREADRDVVFEAFKDRRGELISGTVRRIERGNIMVDLLKAEAILPYREQLPRENVRPGDRIEALVLEVRKEARGSQIVLSRAHPDFVVKLFEREVPEIYEGIVSIKAVAREAATRTKIGVQSRDADVDPVGACVGMKGIRVQAVVNELRGEKIDIVPYSPDPVRFVCSALQPAEVSRVLVDEGERRMEIVVPDDQLSLAIGRRGQNVRLAAEVTGWKLDLHSESKMNERRAIAFESLDRIEGLGELIQQTLYNYGYTSASQVAESEVSALAAIPGIEEERAQQLVEAALTAVASERAERKIRRELARDQASYIYKLYDLAITMPRGEGLDGIPELGAVGRAAVMDSGLCNLAELYVEATEMDLEAFAEAYGWSEGRAWTVAYRAEDAMAGRLDVELNRLVDKPDETDFAAAAEEVENEAPAEDAAEAKAGDVEVADDGEVSHASSPEDAETAESEEGA